MNLETFLLILFVFKILTFKAEINRLVNKKITLVMNELIVEELTISYSTQHSSA